MDATINPSKNPKIIPANPAIRVRGPGSIHAISKPANAPARTITVLFTFSLLVN
jgi:hypothetical protein